MSTASPTSTIQPAPSGTMTRSAHTPAEPCAREALWSMALVKALATGAAFGYAFSTFHLLPKFIVTRLGGGPADIGVVAGMFGAASVLATFFVGAWIDHGPRRRSLVGGCLLLTVAAAAYVLVEDVGVLLGVLRVAQGIAFSMVLSAHPALVAEAAPASRLGEALGLGGASMLVMNALAPAVAEPMAERFGWEAAFGAAAFAALAAAVAAASLREDFDGCDIDGPGGRGLWQVARQRAVMATTAVVAASGVAFGAMFNFLPPYLLTQGAARVGSFFVAYAAAAVAVRLLGGGLADRFGPTPTARAALMAYALVVGAAAAVTPDTVLIFGAVFGLAHGVLFPALSAAAMTAVPIVQRGRLMALLMGGFGLGAYGGATLLGQLAEQAGYPTLFVCAGAVAAAGVPLLSVVASATARQASR